MQTAVAGSLDGLAGELRVAGLEFLQADDVGLLARQPGQQVVEATADAVDIERGDLQRFHALGSSTRACTASCSAPRWAWSASSLSLSQSSQSIAPSSRSASAVRSSSW
ncbi:hypothetical protein WR25_25629 [Diploscapter pachys]|uniref:Uncharacterized protein n=1 Tax=Diploscapter pachys TaxID=2018661 RepID=A0A2A2KA68_9BILA|nr:hypothetical protein WR25_25629 [Diploscapter pachys]